MIEKKVSVLMPAYNCEKYIKQAIDSILNQTYSNLELLIADDGSSDNTKKIIDSFIDKRIKVFHNNKNIGYLKTCNKLFDLCNGYFITFQDADDWSDIHRIEEQVFFLNNEQIEVCGTCISFVSDKGKVLGKQIYPTAHNIVQSRLFDGKANACYASLLFTKNVLVNVGKYRSYFKFGAEDVDFFYRIIEKFEYKNIKKSLYYYRFVPSSITQSVNILKQKASLMLAKELATERIEKGRDILQENDIIKVDLLWGRYFNTLDNIPFSEDIQKQNKLLRRYMYLECTKIWWFVLQKKGPFYMKIAIVMSGLLKMIIKIENYDKLKEQLNKIIKISN